MDPKEIDEIIRQSKDKTKKIVNFVWLIILVFLIVGSFTPAREKAALGLIIFTLGWVMSEVLGRGIVATKALFFKSNNDNNSNKEQ